jgi:hypothetical protein
VYERRALIVDGLARGLVVSGPIWIDNFGNVGGKGSTSSLSVVTRLRPLGNQVAYGTTCDPEALESKAALII